MTRGTITSLKGLVGFFIVIVLAMSTWGLPTMASESAKHYPEFAHLKIPLLTICELAMALTLAFLVCIWALLTRVSKGRIFRHSSFTWVRALMLITLGASITCVTALPFTPGPPTLMLIEILTALACVAIALLLVVMKELLVQAVEFRDELSEVI